MGEVDLLGIFGDGHAGEEGRGKMVVVRGQRSIGKDILVLGLTAFFRTGLGVASFHLAVDNKAVPETLTPV